MRKGILCAAIALCVSLKGGAQAPPATEIYLTDLQIDRGPLVGATDTFINASSNPGYDNQPSFTADSASMLFTSNRDGKQTDIYRYDVAAKATVQLTHTPESEYSPLVTPDGKTFSVVRVEADGAQRLWRFDLDGSNPRLVLENVKPVGYHVWIDATHLGLFVLGAQGQPSTLQIADTTTGKAEVVASNIGRCLLMRPTTNTLTFVSKAQTPWRVMELDTKTRAISELTPTLEGAEDFAWNLFQPSLFMARGSKVFSWWAGASTWAEAGDLSRFGIKNITRLSVHRGQPGLALVAEPIAR